MASLIRTSLRTGLRASSSSAAAPLTFTRGKATLPDLAYDYGALEPSISGKIMELHHKNHHQTYVNSYNTAVEQLQEAQASNNIAAQISLKPLINFHGGGHLNHTLFWENLAPKSAGGGAPPSGALAKALNDNYGSLENFQGQMNTVLAGIQGSGWAWLVQDKQTGNIGIKTYAVCLPFKVTRIPWSASSSLSSEKHGLRAFFSNALRPKKSRQVLRKKNFSASTTDLSTTTTTTLTSDDHDDVPPMPSLAPLQAHNVKYRHLHSQQDTQLGETRDHTAVIHAIGLQNFDTDSDADGFKPRDDRPPGEPLVASLPNDLWMSIADFLCPADVARLALASRTLYARLGPLPWRILNQPENTDDRADFLVSQDRYYPHHLLCFPCGRFHRRTQEGNETLQPANVLNPLFNCPQSRNNLRPPARHRITHGRNIPYTFVQLACRPGRFKSPIYGIPDPLTLSRRWRRNNWSHQSRFLVHKGHLLMRVISSSFADPGLPPSSQRLLLYSRDDYWPYFSACAHWRDGELMSAAKCALTHVPVARRTEGLQGLEHRAKDLIHSRMHDPNALASLCGHCRPMRRCPDCPSEYLIEVKLTEEREAGVQSRFRHAIVVTRWCDLGDGTSPRLSREWAACNGELEGYDSFKILGKRAISGTFEAAFSDETIPGQRIISMNPSGKRLGEKGNDWY
ncbi:uncharacterized protein BJX67DRAFT_372496 [Aspergillus lucknowensis]|uniref:superoxide dismutase n=1 Tax=Aspergillus lucknowensis TaxID=176173 RepID=A0ABR4LT37_9EURO